MALSKQLLKPFAPRFSGLAREQNVELPELGLVLPLSELYKGVDVAAGLLPLREDGVDAVC